MRHLLAILAFFLVSASCASLPLIPIPTQVREGQEQASWVIWHLYGREDTPPSVHWVEGKYLACTSPTGRPGFLTPVGCREGFTWTPFNVSVAWRPDDFFSTTALAHEDMHAAQARVGVIDPGHTRAEWQPGGLVDKAIGRLMEMGQ